MAVFAWEKAASRRGQGREGENSPAIRDHPALRPKETANSWAPGADLDKPPIKATRPETKIHMTSYTLEHYG